MATTYLRRTPGGSGNQRKFTFSFWVKKSSKNPAGTYSLFDCGTSTNYFHIYFPDTHTLTVKSRVSNSTAMELVTRRVFRDPSAWYHFVVAVDSEQSTAADRCKIYVNGVQETSFSSENYGSQNLDHEIQDTASYHYIGTNYAVNADEFFDGSMSHVHFVDGSQLAPTVFGSTDSVTGEWKINTSPSYTVGANGFFILKDGNSVTDQSANSNNWTVQAGTLTATEDCPSNNFATWNLNMQSAEDGNWSNGNTTIAPNGDGTYLYAPTTIGVSSGKWYSEHMITGGNGYGMLGGIYSDNIITGFRDQTGLGTLANSFGFRCRDGAIRMGSSNTTYGSAPGTSSAILGMALDMDNKKVWYHVNGTYVTYGGGVGNPGAGTYGFDFSSLTGSIFLITCGDDTSSGYGNFKSNFGNGVFGTTAISSEGSNTLGHGKFEYDVPSGFTALCTKGLNE